MDAERVSAWFGKRKVLDRLSIDMPAGQVTALIGPAGSLPVLSHSDHHR